ncbi:MAG: type VI secretion system protein TssL, long form [Gammaproteobacteria bacterium]|nr:type VI secretion system protein TssL, long form [Gammaproteobacteria bacterium]
MSAGGAPGAAPGAPAWMTTFADLMALMMTFFVLLYSFSSIDETKYREIARSMASGFGGVLRTTQTPPANTVGPTSMIDPPMRRSKRGKSTSRKKGGAQQDLEKELQKSLASEIAEGIIAVETSGNNVVIRFPDEIAFPSGSDEISDAIMPILERVTNALQEAPGLIMVSGHTDDRPIQSEKFRSNWSLSTDRAVTVIQRLEELGTIDSSRISAVGYGDTRPLAPNDSPENRARNRRVEIAIVQE